ncbi:hypothetical protein, partial [Escherichia coli]|uniref:hypothetical protein n=1 Tax=Escherichia coli TaxID=562 RepID=UPI001BC8BBEE
KSFLSQNFSTKKYTDGKNGGKYSVLLLSSGPFMQSWLSPETNRVWQGWRGTLHPVRVFPADAGLRRFTVRCFRIFGAAAFHAADAA